MSYVEICPLDASTRRRYVSLSSLPVIRDVGDQEDEWTDLDEDEEDDEYNIHAPRTRDDAPDGVQGMPDKIPEDAMDIDTQEDHMNVDDPPSRTLSEDVPSYSLRKRKR